VRWQNPGGVATPLSQGQSLPCAIDHAKAVSSLRFATVDSLAPRARLALRAAFGSPSRPSVLQTLALSSLSPELIQREIYGVD
jgi:hypothetical protein